MTTKKSIENPMGFSFRSTQGVAELEALSKTSQHLGHAFSMTPRQKNNALPKNSTSLEVALAQLTADRLNINVDDIKITLFAISDKGTGSPYNPLLKENPTRFSTSSSEKLEKVLPFIAWGEHVDNWQESYNLEQKQNIVATARQVHAQKGTIGALKLALDNLNIGATIEEWFDYGGKPYYFRIQIKPENGLSEKENIHLFEIIDETKNLRSILDKIIAHFNVNGRFNLGGAPTIHHHLKLFPASVKPKNVYGDIYIGGGTVIQERITLKTRPLQNKTICGGYFIGGAMKVTEKIYVG